jgi:hypothetical protein
MEDRNTAPGAGIASQATERVVSIMDFDASGMITCLIEKPVAGGPGFIRDSRSTRSISTTQWRDINGK